MRKNECSVCGEKLTKRYSKMCFNCLSAKAIIQRTAQAMMKLHGVPAASGICVDCGSKPATERDHRYYASPLRVDFVCSPCNKRRGAALDLHDMIKQHRGLKKIDDEVFSGEIEVIELPKAVESDGITFPVNLDQIIEREQKRYIQAALEITKFNRTKAARLLGITFRSIRYRIENLGIDV